MSAPDEDDVVSVGCGCVLVIGFMVWLVLLPTIGFLYVVGYLK